MKRKLVIIISIILVCFIGISSYYIFKLKKEISTQKNINEKLAAEKDELLIQLDKLSYQFVMAQSKEITQNNNSNGILDFFKRFNVNNLHGIGTSYAGQSYGTPEEWGDSEIIFYQSNDDAESAHRPLYIYCPDLKEGVKTVDCKIIEIYK